MRNKGELEAAAEPLVLGGHIALELLNTVSLVDGQLMDAMKSDADVGRWLTRVGYPLERGVKRFQQSALLDAARRLREIIRDALELRKAGQRCDASKVNRFLQQAQSHLRLVMLKSGELSLVREWLQDAPEGAFGPVAEAAAELLAGDLELVRRCESSECVLWFVDRTKSHHRRWCSTSTCGNRHKVAAFRKRQKDSA